uniref:Proline-rich protein n=1 Tax=Oryza brachyantha TaxID=4533 RepID=J3N0X5_ORYBR
MGARWPLHDAALMLAVVAVVTTAAAAAAAGSAGETTAVVVGAAKCGDCGRKNMDAEAAFKGLKVAIKCKNGSSDEYESKAVGDLDGTGAFAVPLDAGVLRGGGGCVAQLHSAASNGPCPGQEPSRDNMYGYG